MRTLVWYREEDLRIEDHAPLRDAAEKGEVVPLFVLDPATFSRERARRAPNRIQFLLESAAELESRFARVGSRLLVVAGSSTTLVPQLAKQWLVDRVVAQRSCLPAAREQESRIQRALDVPLELFEGQTLHPLGTLRTKAGEPFSVFTPFARAFFAQHSLARPLPAPRSLPALPRAVRTRSVPLPTCEELGLFRNPRVLRGGERAAKARLARFLAGPAAGYEEFRNRLDLPGTSRLSVDLNAGTISPRTVWNAASRALENTAPHALRSFLNELVWREFTHSTLWDHPELLREPFQARWRGFPWLKNASGWRAWVGGTTGYPLVDASARQLLGEGFVHNRARMISASFLTKHLLMDFRRGEVHYLRFLTDGNPAQNDSGWQWSAGCGCDAQPYFRIFNPVAQAERFDPTGEYIRSWVPELASLPTPFIHRPWTAPSEVLAGAGVSLGRNYPRPIIDHALARSRYLEVAKAFLTRARR